MSKIFSSLLTITCIICITACKKDEKPQTDPIVETQSKAKISLISGNSQSAEYGEYLPNELSFKIAIPQDTKASQYYIEFALIQGNGTVDSGGGTELPNIQLDGTVKVKWQLGCNTPIQKIKAYIYANTWDGKPSAPQDSVEIQATGTKPTAGWAKACGCGKVDSYGVQITSFDNKTLYLVNRDLYKSTDNGINWVKVNGIPRFSEIVNAKFNSKGWLYILTRFDGVLYSKDLKNWQAINNGIVNKKDPTGFMVEDDILMVSFYSDGPYLTTNNGGSWQKLHVSDNSQRFMLFNKHADGDLYLFDDFGTFFRSKDTGKSWQRIKLDYGYSLSHPMDFAIGPDGNFYIGSTTDAIFAQISPLTLNGKAKRYYEWNISTQSAGNISFFKGDVFYLLRYTPKSGVYSIKNNWERIELDFSEQIFSYYIKSDGTFLLGSRNGLYYKN